MANLNKTECQCTGIYNATTMTCDIPDAGVDPCPSFWSQLATWDWQGISDTSLQWGYALGIFNPPPNDQMQQEAYQREIQRQRNTMTMLVIGFIIVVAILVVYIVRNQRKRR